MLCLSVVLLQRRSDAWRIPGLIVPPDHVWLVCGHQTRVWIEETMRSVILKLKRLALLGLALWVGAANASSWSTDHSDLWWNSAEPGWGMQLVQSTDAIFATVFAFDAGSKPVWFTAHMTPQSPWPDLVSFRGKLYSTTGPWFGGFFTPSVVETREVGTILFLPYENGTGFVEYTVGDVTVSKTISRLSLGPKDFNGSYFLTTGITVQQCSTTVRNVFWENLATVLVTQTPEQLTMKWSSLYETGSCTLSGSFQQTGRLATVSGTYACTSGETGSMRVYELAKQPHGMNGLLEGTSTTHACHYSGSFSGGGGNVRLP